MKLTPKRQFQKRAHPTGMPDLPGRLWDQRRHQNLSREGLPSPRPPARRSPETAVRAGWGRFDHCSAQPPLRMAPTGSIWGLSLRPFKGSKEDIYDMRGTKDYRNIRITHSGSKAQYKEDARNHSSSDPCGLRWYFG